MEQSKFLELQEAFTVRLKAWDQYERDTHDFVRGFREALIGYLGASGDTIKWARFAEPSPDNMADNFVKQTASRHMWLDNDAFWHFSFRLEFSSGFVQWFLKVKPQDGKFLVVNDARLNHIAPRELLVSPPDYSELVKHFYEALKQYMKRDFHELLKPAEMSGGSIGFGEERR